MIKRNTFYNIFIAIVIIHFLEHVVQLYQLYILDWPRPQCLGLLSLNFPWLMTSEWLHYLFAYVMLWGLIEFKDKALNKKWWNTAKYLQYYHYLEHMILLLQMMRGIPFAERISIGGLFFPRMELHFFYNLMIIIPMMLALIPFSNANKERIH